MSPAAANVVDMPEPASVTLVRSYVELLEARDWARLRGVLHPDVVYRLPQTGEVVRGRETYVRWNVEYPDGWHLRLAEAYGDADGGAARLDVNVGVEEMTALVFVRLRDGLLAEITDYWPEPYDAPPGRAHLADPHVLGDGMAPTPFTADEIRGGCPQGRSITLLVERAGARPVVRVNRFVTCDDEAATVESVQLSSSGEPVGAPVTERSTWRELQEHASFPADRTVVRQEMVDTPLGDLDCLRYTVVDGDRVKTLWFATALPGMPVRFETLEGGRVVERVSMIRTE